MRDEGCPPEQRREQAAPGNDGVKAQTLPIQQQDVQSRHPQGQRHLALSGYASPGWGSWNQRGHPGTNSEILRVDSAPWGVETLPLLADLWLAGAYGVSPRRDFRDGKRAKYHRTRDNQVPSSEYKSVLLNTTPTNRGRNRTPSRSIPSRTVFFKLPLRDGMSISQHTASTVNTT